MDLKKLREFANERHRITRHDDIADDFFFNNFHDSRFLGI